MGKMNGDSEIPGIGNQSTFRRKREGGDGQTSTLVAHDGGDDELHKEESDQNQAGRSGETLYAFRCFAQLMPDSALADGDRGQRAEKNLSQTAVDDGVVDLIFQYPHAAEDSLNDDEHKRGKSHAAHPAAPIHPPNPDGQSQSKVTNYHAQEAVAVLGRHGGVLGPALGIERAIGEWPVGKNHPRTDGRREAACVEQK